MRRRSITALLVGVLMALVLGTAVSASSHKREKSSGHAFVGLWIVDADTSSQEEPPALLTVSGDGTLRLSDWCSSPSAGVWVASGSGAANVTLLLPWGDEEGFIGFNSLRGTVSLAEDGKTFTASYTLDIPVRDGSTSGQLGPQAATGVRVSVEPMGEPVGPFVNAEPEPEPTLEALPSPDAVPAPEASASPEG